MTAADATKDREDRIADARAIIAACKPIAGTSAEDYLAGRGIDAKSIPDGVAGWCEDKCTLVWVLRDQDGTITACNRLYFGRDGKPLCERPGKKKRLSKGLVKGAAAVFDGSGDILICEGAEDGASLWQATRQPVRVAFGTNTLADVPLPDGARCIIVADNDAPGLAASEKAARALAKRGHSMRIAAPPDGIKDANELHAKQGAEALRAMVAAAKPFEAENEPGKAAGGLTDAEVDAEIARLATLSLVAYERARPDAAKRCGMRASTLDKVVIAARPQDAPTGQGRPLELATPEPWPEPVDGAALIAEIEGAIRRYVILPENGAFTIVLWCLHSFCFDRFTCSPHLAITSPVKRCGKTTLLDIIGQLVPRPLPAANISASATFRTIEAARPALLIDEADTFLGGNDELRGILNSGHRAGGQTIRTVGDNFEPRSFSTFCPIAIAMIGKLPDTLADRAIHIQMKRRAPGEKVARFRLERTPELVEAARKAARWVADNEDAIVGLDPTIPTAVFNRDADNWEPLLSIAEVIGGEVPERARKVALATVSVEEETDYKTLLLADIRDAFAGLDEESIPSKRLAEILVGADGQPWGECNHGKPITQNWLARRLKDFGVHTKNERNGAKVPKAYFRADFSDAFTRYLSQSPSSSSRGFSSDDAREPPNPTFQSATPLQSNEINNLGEKANRYKTQNVADEKTPISLKTNGCSGVAVENPGNGRLREHETKMHANSSVAGNGGHPTFQERQDWRDAPMAAEPGFMEPCAARAGRTEDRNGTPHHFCFVCGVLGCHHSNHHHDRWFCDTHKAERNAP